MSKQTGYHGNTNAAGHGAPEGNANARKGETVADARLACRCTPELRQEAIKAAGESGSTLSQWLCDAVKLKLEEDHL